MYNVTEGVLDRMATLIARGDDAGLLRYLGHIIPQGDTLVPLRDALFGAWTEDVRKLALRRHPWLAHEVFGYRPADRIREAIRAAGYAGLSASEIRPLLIGRAASFAWAGLIKSGEVVAERGKTGGRPTTHYRLASAQQAGDDPFAFKPDPAFLDR